MMKTAIIVAAAILSITGGASAACPPPAVPYNVLDFGAVPNGILDDQPAIQAAIDCAALKGQPIVYFPPGRYLLKRTLRAEVDDLTLSGSAAAVLIVDPGQDVIDSTPEAILVNRIVGNALVPTTRVTIRDLTLDVRNGTNGKDVSFGVIQLNDCIGCVVKDVRMFWGGRQIGNHKPRNVDGIVMSQGTSGLIENVIVSGIPKGGIYVAQGSHDVTVANSEVMNTDGPIGRVGITITGATHSIVSGCISHDNAEDGLFIATNGPIHNAPPVEADNIQVLGGEYYNNGVAGVWVGSAYHEAVPHDVQLANVNAHTNQGPGIVISGAEDVTISNPIVHDNGAQGLLIQTPLWQPPVPRRTARILVSAPLIFDNGCSIATGVGIHLNSAAEITIDGGRLYGSPHPSQPSCKQTVAVLLWLNTNNVANDTVRILDVDTSPSIAPGNLVIADPAAAAVTHGFYRLQGSGKPGALPAPDSSQYTDLSTGKVYRRIAGVWTTP
jgi:hypothetical protein